MIKSLSDRFSRSTKTPDREIILHVGMDKTGTSAIQAFLHKNRELLLEDTGVYYPETGLWSDYSHHPYAFSLFGMNGFSVRDFLKLSRKLDRETKGKKSVLISSECLFKAPTRDEFDVFTSFIRRHFSSVKVIVYLRRQDLWIESRYKHSIISGNEISLEALSRPNFCDYKRFIDLWRDSFGAGSIVVRPYEKSQFKGGNIFSDFLSIFGQKIDDRWHLPERQVNVALGYPETEFKRFCNAVGFNKGMVDQLNALLLAHTEISDDRNDVKLLPGTRCKEICDRYKEINRAIVQEYLPGKSDALFVEEVSIDELEGDAISDVSDEDFLSVLSFIKEQNNAVFKKLVKLTKSSSPSPIKEFDARSTLVLSSLES